MASARAARGGHGGGADITSQRPSRARLALVAASLALAAGQAAWVAAEGGSFGRLLGFAGRAGVAVLAGGHAVRGPGAVPWSVAFLGTQYVAGPLAAAALVATLTLAARRREDG